MFGDFNQINVSCTEFLVLTVMLPLSALIKLSHLNSTAVLLAWAGLGVKC